MVEELFFHDHPAGHEGRRAGLLLGRGGVGRESDELAEAVGHG